MEFGNFRIISIDCIKEGEDISHVIQKIWNCNPMQDIQAEVVHFEYDYRPVMFEKPPPTLDYILLKTFDIYFQECRLNFAICKVAIKCVELDFLGYMVLVRLDLVTDETTRTIISGKSNGQRFSFRPQPQIDRFNICYISVGEIIRKNSISRGTWFEGK